MDRGRLGHVRNGPGATRERVTQPKGASRPSEMARGDSGASEAARVRLWSI